MSPWDPFQGVTEPEFLISSQRLGHVTLNLGYLAKKSEMTVSATRSYFFIKSFHGAYGYRTKSLNVRVLSVPMERYLLRPDGSSSNKL